MFFVCLLKMNNMKKRVKKLVTLKSGGVVQIFNDTMECPMCLNGRMIFKTILGDEWIVMECQECGTVIQIPFVSITEEPLDE